MENQEQIDEYIKTKVSEALFKDASDHRQFMESTFKHITWAIGILVIVVAVAGTWLFGKSVESASREKVKQFMKETDVPILLKAEIEAAFSQEKEGIPERAKEAVDRILKSETGKQLKHEIEIKIDEIKKLSGSALIASQLVGPAGPPGPAGNAGKPGRDLEFPVGTIISSSLSPEQMASQFGDKWQLADGSTVDPRSTYTMITGQSVLPDLRGVFLRGLNLNRNDGMGDPDGSDRTFGSYQKDIFQAHTHAGQFPSNVGYSNLIKGNGDQVVRWEQRTERVSMTGGAENRPRNVAVYLYIKVN